MSKDYCPKCLKIGVLERGVLSNGSADYCYRHYRVMKARESSKAANKITPSFEHLMSIIPHNMRCSECSREMIYHSKLGYRGDVISLQHWPSGEVSWICCSCNTIHANTNCKWEDYIKIAPDSKWCSSCKCTKTKYEFAKNTSVPDGLQSICKTCEALQRIQRKQPVSS